MSLFELSFEDESFDIIWSEGSIYPIGFERGLQELRNLLKSGGCLVIHDAIEGKADRVEIIHSNGYRLLGHFNLSQELWHQEYFIPLKKRHDILKTRDKVSEEDKTELQRLEKEIQDFENYPNRQQSEFFVMQKTD